MQRHTQCTCKETGAQRGWVTRSTLQTWAAGRTFPPEAPTWGVQLFVGLRGVAVVSPARDVRTRGLWDSSGVWYIGRILSLSKKAHLCRSLVLQAESLQAAGMSLPLIFVEKQPQPHTQQAPCPVLTIPSGQT